MQKFKFILAWLLVSAFLLASVVLVDVAVTTFKHLFAGKVSITPVHYPVKDMVLGILSESLRALLLCYLFPQQKSAGRSLPDAIRFGLVISALIGTMWLIIGYGSFVLRNPGSWFLFDAAILALQGLLSGMALHLLHKRRFI